MADATIVYVHGNGNKVRKELLKSLWDKALFGTDLGAASRMAYWAPLRYPAPLPDHLPAWLNIYDRRDLLGYIGAQLFPGRVRDVEVDNRQPFPAAHSAYWANRTVYRTIVAELP